MGSFSRSYFDHTDCSSSCFFGIGNKDRGIQFRNLYIIFGSAHTLKFLSPFLCNIALELST